MGEPQRSEATERQPDVARSERRRRRRSSSHSSTRLKRRRLRVFYFSLAALWGFMAGSAAVLVGLAAVGQPPGLGTRGTIYVACAVVLALIGGVVVAAAYHTASRRVS